MNFPSCEEIHRRFRYDKESGRIVRVISPGGGVPADAFIPTDWTTLNGKKYATKKLAWVLHYNEDPPSGIWFVDSDPANLSRSNLESKSMREARTYRPPKVPNPQPRKRDEDVVPYIFANYTYDPDTGLLQGRSKNGRVSATPGTGSISVRGYVKLKIKQSTYLAHRVAWLLKTGEWPPEGKDIDHINQVRSDNRWVNLRLATNAENLRNRKTTERSKSGRNGVRPYEKRPDKWKVTISVGGRLKSVGVYAELETAISARIAAEKEHYGEFAPLK